MLHFTRLFIFTWTSSSLPPSLSLSLNNRSFLALFPALFPPYTFFVLMPFVLFPFRLCPKIFRVSYFSILLFDVILLVTLLFFLASSFSQLFYIFIFSFSQRFSCYIISLTLFSPSVDSAHRQRSPFPFSHFSFLRSSFNTMFL